VSTNEQVDTNAGSVGVGVVERECCKKRDGEACQAVSSVVVG